MPHDDSKKSGQWVFRNHRWCYVPRSVSELEVTAPRLTPGRLWSFLDMEGLVRQIRGVQSLFQVPMMLALETWDEPDVELHSRSREPDKVEVLPAVWCTDDSELDVRLMEQCTAEMLFAVSQGLAEKSPQTLPGIWGPTSVRGIPLLLSYNGALLSLGAIAMVRIDQELYPSPQAIVEQLGPLGTVPLSWAEAIWKALPAPGARHRAYRLLGELLSSFAKNAEREVDGRLELASEQARSRQLLLRAEGLEQQVLKGSAEMNRASDFGYLPRADLEALLDIPELGIIVEDTDYRVRYLNPYMRRHFGDAVGRLCYETINKGTAPCEICPIKKLWGEGWPTFRYTNRSNTTGQMFEVIAVPFMSKDGEKLILEVGLNMTDLHNERDRIVASLTRLTSRNAELQELTRSLNMVVFDNFQEIQEVLEVTSSSVKREHKAHEELFLDPSLPLAIWERLLDKSLERLEALISESRRLSLSLGSVGLATSVDVRSLLLTMSGGTSGLWRELPTPEVGEIPPVVTNSAALAMLLGAWMRAALDKHGVAGAKPFLWHTMSSSPDALFPGTGYHVLAMRCVDGGASVCSAALLPRRGTRLFDGTQIGLLARYLGGKVREETSLLGLTHYLSIPKEPPNDIRCP